MNVSDAIRLKRAVRKFADQPLPEEAILAILNAGRRALSAAAWLPRSASVIITSISASARM